MARRRSSRAGACSVVPATTERFSNRFLASGLVTPGRVSSLFLIQSRGHAMPAARQYRRRAGPRDRLYLGRPDLWGLHPFLPLVRYPMGEPLECGVLYDAVGAT